MAKLTRAYGDDDAFKVYEGDPEELRKLVTASRRKGFRIRASYQMGTTEGRAYPMSYLVRVTQAEALAFIADAARFRKLKAETHPDTPEEDLPKLEWTVTDNLIFIN